MFYTNLRKKKLLARKTMTTWVSFHIYSAQSEYRNKNIQTQMTESVILFVIF